MIVPESVAYASKYLSLCASLGAAYWLGDTHEIEPFVTLIGSLAAYIFTDVYVHPQPPASIENPAHREHDRLLLAELLSDFPSDGEVMRFLSEQDLGSSFSYDPISKLERIAERWTGAEHEFLDDELERLKGLFLESAKRFIRETASKTQPLGGGRVTIGMEDFETRTEMLDLREHLNKLGWQVYHAHQDLVKAARRKLPPALPSS